MSTAGILLPISKTSTYTFSQWSSAPSTIQAQRMCSLYVFVYAIKGFCFVVSGRRELASHHQPQWELCKDSAEKGSSLNNGLRVKNPKPLTCHHRIICSHLKCRFLKPSLRWSYLEVFDQGLGISILTEIPQGILLQIRIYKTKTYSHKYSQLIFNKGAKAIPRSKTSLFNKRCQNS